MKIKLSNGAEAQVSRKDFDRLIGYNWHQKNGRRPYAFRVETIEGKRRQILMHREIMGAKDGEVVDHINGDPIDNRRRNLRIVDHRTNMLNTRKVTRKTSRYKGVCFERKSKKYRATIVAEGKQLHLGYYSRATEAAKSYDEAARRFYGSDGVYNFPQKGERPAIARNS